ncbi:hypothetical protein ACQ4M4_06495 [Leptolyngbya sp. AN02str]|uniref:DUF3024 domain-containing protein n=1 Tax=Leptolyngbya sp. AN02str TaxID=3423363 RepID=UPI003D317B21
MANRKRKWIYAPSKAKQPKPKVPEPTKALIQQQFDELIESCYKPRYLNPPRPDSSFSSLTDIFGKWYRNYFYICGMHTRSEDDESSQTQEFRFARYEYVGPDQFNIAYMRHTGQWWQIGSDRTLEQCLHEARINEILHPFSL